MLKLLLFIHYYVSYRHNLITSWCEHLTKAGISFRQDLALSEYLGNPDERLRWKENSLPDDDLCTENAIMLKVRNLPAQL